MPRAKLPYDSSADPEVEHAIDAARQAELSKRALESELRRTQAELQATRAALKTCAAVLKPYGERQ
jgi:hypothetical protein